VPRSLFFFFLIFFFERHRIGFPFPFFLPGRVKALYVLPFLPFFLLFFFFVVSPRGAAMAPGLVPLFFFLKLRHQRAFFLFFFCPAWFFFPSTSSRDRCVLLSFSVFLPLDTRSHAIPLFPPIPSPRQNSSSLRRAPLSIPTFPSYSRCPFVLRSHPTFPIYFFSFWCPFLFHDRPDEPFPLSTFFFCRLASRRASNLSPLFFVCFFFPPAEPRFSLSLPFFSLRFR